MAVTELPPLTGSAAQRTRRRPRRWVALAALVAVVVLAAVAVRDVTRPALQFDGSSRPDGGAVTYRPPYWLGSDDVYLVNLPSTRVGTVTVSIRNTTGHAVRLDHVHTGLDDFVPTPAAQLAVLDPVGGDMELTPYRAAVGATIAAGGRAALRLSVRGRGCHGREASGAESVELVTLGYRRLGVQRSVDIDLPFRLTVVDGNTQADDGPCGLAGLPRT